MRARADERSKIRPTHRERAAYVYVRQSSPKQVREHVESRHRQYALVDWAVEAGWPRERVIVIDEDQGKSSAIARTRKGFARLISAVAQGEVGIVIALEATRLARNSPDWHHLIYLCRWSDTLIADEHTIYDPDSPSDRMVLGIRGQMSELELETLIERMVQARWNKARRGELITTPPAGHEIDDLGQLVITSDEAVSHAIRTVFEKFDELGSARQVFVWWQQQGLKFPVRRMEIRTRPVVWIEPKYRMILQTLHHPIYSGAYVFGKTETVRELAKDGSQTLRVRRVKRNVWPILIRDHHPAYLSYDKFLSNQERLRSNAMILNPKRTTGPAREGPALLQGLVMCGHCSRKMNLSYGGHKSAHTKKIYQYRCVQARHQIGVGDCQVVGGKRIDDLVVEAFLEATQPCALEAARRAHEEAHKQGETIRRYWQHQIEKAEYEAQRAERQYQVVEPENRIVARELERRWNERLKEVERVRTQARDALRAEPLLSEEELVTLRLLCTDLRDVWNAETTTNRDRKRLLRCLIEEVQLRTDEKHHGVRIVWKGGAITEREVLRRKAGTAHRTPEDTVALVRTLAKEFDDAQIARILNRQGRRSGLGNPFTKQSVMSLRGHHRIPKCPQREAKDPVEGPFTADEAARELGVTMSTIHRWLREGVLAGEQVTSGAPWRIILSDEIRRRLTGGNAPDGWVGLTEAARRLGLSKSRVAYLVNTGKLPAVRATVGKRRCWRIDVSSTTYADQTDLFDQIGNTDSRET